MCCIVIERYGQNLTISIPARFRGDERTKIDRFAYLPFGVGPRICIGATFAIQEALIMVAAVMRHFTLEMASGRGQYKR
jgi:cytochrome P450